MNKMQLNIAPLLRLQALDEQDLAVISAHVQDAIVRVGDIAYLPKKRRFGLEVARFDWLAAAEGRLERCLTALHFEAVKSVRCQRVPRDAPDTLLMLLAVTFEPSGEPPGGFARLIFAGGAEIRLELECIEAALADEGLRWKASCQPGHA
jgi:hypothetical protein